MIKKTASQDKEKYLEQALYYYKEHDTSKSKRLTRECIKMHGESPEALALLSAIAKLEKQDQKAIDIMQKAIALAPHQSQWYNNLAILYYENNQMSLAEQCLSHALEIENSNEISSKSKDILNNYAICQYSNKDIIKSLDTLNQAINLDPKYALTHRNCAVLHIKQGNSDAALNVVKNALNTHPNDSSFIDLAVIAHLMNGEPYLASRLIERSFESELYESKDDLIQILINSKLNKFNLGLCYLRTQNQEEAIRFFHKTLEKEPKHLKSLFHLGKAYQTIKQNENATPYLTQAKDLAPKNNTIRSWYVYHLLSLAMWNNLANEIAILNLNSEKELSKEEGSGLIPFIGQHIFIPPEQQLGITKSYMKKSILPKSQQFNHLKTKKSIINIGFIGPNINGAPIGWLLKQWLGYLNKDKFSLHIYDLAPKDNELNHFFKNHADVYISLKDDNDKEASQKIYRQNTDILINLAGPSTSFRPQILAHQPAPIQCYYLGDVGTLAVPYIQYYFCTQREVPDNIQNQFSESLIYFPKTVIALNSMESLPNIAERTYYQLPDDKFIYACFNNIYRIEPTVFDAWLDILAKVPNSVLWLQARDEMVKINIYQYIQSQSEIDINRIIITAYEPMHKYYHHRYADLYLDTFTVSGRTSTLLAYQIGLPVLTYCGNSPHNRYGAAMAHAAGLDSLITYTYEEYINKAVSLGNHPNALKEIKSEWLNNKDNVALFSPKQLALNFEKAFQKMHTLYHKDMPWEDIIID